MLVVNNKIENGEVVVVNEDKAGNGVVLTHNGVFHADELTAISLLIIFGVMVNTIVRTRDVDVIDEFKISNDGLLIDIGGEFNPDNGVFDHHHNKDGVNGKASAGIIADMLQISEEKYPSLSKLIAEVDSQDIGVKLNPDNHFSNIIKSYNVITPFGEDNNDAFKMALEFTVRYLLNLKLQDEADYVDRLEVEKAEIREVNRVKVVVRSKESKFIPAIKFAGKADLVISYDAQQNCWSVQTAPIKAGDFASKYKLVKGCKEEIFTHPAGFISKLKSVNGYVYPIVDGVGEVKIPVEE